MKVTNNLPAAIVDAVRNDSHPRGTAVIHIRGLLAQKFQVLVFHEDPEVRQVALDIWEILYPKKKRDAA